MKKKATVHEAAIIADKIQGNDTSPAQRRVLPAGWRTMASHVGGADFTDGELVVVMHGFEDNSTGAVIVHAAVRKADGRRANWQQMTVVKRLFFDDRKGKVYENNKIIKTSESTRHLWQVIGSEEFEEKIIGPILNSAGAPIVHA